jgi:rare lipoprotein A
MSPLRLPLRLLAASIAACVCIAAPLSHAQPAAPAIIAPAPLTQSPMAQPLTVQPPIIEATAVEAPALKKRAKRSRPDAAEGRVAYYGGKFAGRKTANGERFNPNALTMAHPSLPFGTMVRVTNLRNNKRVVVRVNDRGPSTPDRIGDLSRAAAVKLNMLKSGVANVRLDVLGQPGKAHRISHRPIRKSHHMRHSKRA